jgi:peptidylprolyl isomerase
MILMRKWLVISGGMIVSVLVLAGGVIWYIRGHQEDDLVRAVEKLVGYEVPVENESAPKGPVVLNSTTDENSKNSASNDLAVGPSEAGQLPQMLPPNGQSQSKSKPSSSSDSAQNDTSTFVQYDKYKDSPTALYQDFTIGNGAEAAGGKAVLVNYRGWLTNGELFDDSYQRGKPYRFQLGAGAVIPGWEQAIAGMKAGGKRRFIVPPHAGYGDQAKGPIPANSVLVFDVELLDVE